MANPWYYARNNQQAGPVEWEQLQQLAASGALTRSDMVWSEGMANWSAAATIPGLFPAAPNFATPVPTYGSAPSTLNVVPLGPLSGQGQYAAPWTAQNASPPYPGGQPQQGVQVLGYYAQTAPHFAGFWIRFVALLIDGLILVVVCGLLKSALDVRVSAGQWPFDRIGTPGWWLEIIVRFAYFATLESSVTQATLGKMAVGIKVIDKTGNRLSFAHALGRYAAKIVSDLTLLIGYIMAAFTEKKQGLHDLIAGTFVVYK